MHAVRDKDDGVRSVKIGQIRRPAVVNNLGFDVLETGTVEHDLQQAGCLQVLVRAWSLGLGTGNQQDSVVF